MQKNAELISTSGIEKSVDDSIFASRSVSSIFVALTRHCLSSQTTNFASMNKYASICLE